MPIVLTDAEIQAVAARGDGPVVLDVERAPHRTNEPMFHGYGNQGGYQGMFYGTGIVQQIFYMTLIGAGVEVFGAVLKKIFK